MAPGPAGRGPTRGGIGAFPVGEGGLRGAEGWPEEVGVWCAGGHLVDLEAPEGVLGGLWAAPAAVPSLL